MQKQQTNILNTFAVSPFGEYYLPSINRSQFEKLDSTTQYNAKFKKDFSQENTLHIVVGLDSGLLANYVLEIGVPEGSRFIFIELEAALTMLDIEIPAPFKDSLEICTQQEFNQLIENKSLELFIIKDKCSLYRSLGASSNHLEDYTLLSNDIEKQIQHTFFESEVIFTQKIFVKTQLENIIENQTPASVLQNTFNGMSCIVIAGGPSLDHHLEWIKSQSKNLVIIAVSRIASKLVNEGITPHIIVSVDPQDHSFEVNREMMDLHKESLFVQSFHVCSRMSAQWQGRTLYLGGRVPWDSSLDMDNIESVGPTVTNSSVHLALRMGFSQILLSGVDFCHSRDGFTHAKGTLEASLGPNLGQICEWVDTYAGYKAETLIQLQYAIESLQTEVERFPDRTFINLAQSAAVVNGVKYQPMQEIELEPIPPKQLQLLQQVAAQGSVDDKVTDIQARVEDLTKAVKSMKEILSLSSEAIEHNQQMIEQVDNQVLIKEKAEAIEEIEQKLKGQYHAFSQLVKFYGYYEFTKFLSTKDAETWSQSQLNEMRFSYYDAFQKMSERLLELLSSALKRSQSRLLEFDKHANITVLAKQWQEDNQQGRVRIWQQFHSNKLKFCNAEELALIKALESEYQTQLTNDRKVYVDTVKQTTTLERAFVKIMVLINTKHHTGLKQMAIYLQPFTAKDDEAKRLYHLCYGHQLLLEERAEEALACMLELPETLITEPESKLIMLLSLKLFKLDLASKALSKAITYSDEYQPRYAYVLSLQGQNQEALNIYLNYLEKYPSDIMVWLKFGSFMYDVDELDAAFDAFNHVIESDPDNQVALRYLAKIKNDLA
ncbi:motility associated factor glycosyltransferase family protein [Shewanella woodyi]|uniref:motility associated factor glycosyltransferase family protein n=1 Tax=Shewanella woodyi TaxID=60961 RepID=UPI0007EB2E71|nr:6-hydroxymethylpterin diphosphokinase MptE-like protein [Shewanella woodyi]